MVHVATRHSQVAISPKDYIIGIEILIFFWYYPSSLAEFDPCLLPDFSSNPAQQVVLAVEVPAGLIDGALCLLWLKAFTAAKNSI